MTQPSIPLEALNAAFHKFSNSLSAELKQHMNGRLERGLQIVKAGGVTPIKDNRAQNQRLYHVTSSNPHHPPYLVNLGTRTCTCPDHWKGHYCKHRVAAHVFELAGAQLEKVRFKEVNPAVTKSITPIDGEVIIWACVNQDGKTIGVEVLGIESDMVRIQALPAITDKGKLEPQFPFPNGAYTHLVDADDLFRISIYRNG
jgi:SWIM zinc finger